MNIHRQSRMVIGVRILLSSYVLMLKLDGIHVSMHVVTPLSLPPQTTSSDKFVLVNVVGGKFLRQPFWPADPVFRCLTRRRNRNPSGRECNRLIPEKAIAPFVLTWLKAKECRVNKAHSFASGQRCLRRPGLSLRNQRVL